MKQRESKLFNIGIGAARIMELSLYEDKPYPSLTIMTPMYPGAGEDHDIPANSMELTGSCVRDLYEALREYYGDNKKEASG